MDTKYFGFITILKKNGSISSRCPIISKEFNIGRSSNNDIRIYLDSVSNNHCTILFVDNKAYIRDKSRAGSTKVNGKKIGRNNFLLRESDEIDISDRKLIFNYASISSKTSWIRTDCTSLKTQISSPLVNNKKPQTPRTITMTPSKKSVQPPRTPIVETNNHISNESFEELKKKPCDEVPSTKTKPDLLKSFSVTSGQNIPVLNNSKSTPRKSWKANNMSSSCARILDILSSDRKKRDVTPEMNTSYRFLDEEVEYDSPIPICDQEDLFEESVNTNVTAVDSSKISEKTLNNDVDDVEGNNVNWQPSSSIAVDSNLPESTPSTSRRETYSIEDGPIVIEQNSTPAPRRSILKCSKTAKTCRSRSNNRMVQFARLPKTDSKIKSTKFYSGNSFTVIDDKSADNDHFQVNQNDKSFNIEDNETDDLDGVRPLDTSVSSLMNSPILDQVTLNKSSSKRGSRGNKVMSLISSFEKRTNESPKQNLKASDLLSMNVSRNEEAFSNKSPEDTTSISQKSSTSLRRINLEDMFVAEDSMKNSVLESEDKLIIEGINLNSTQSTETSDSAKSLLHNTISKELSVGTLDSSKVLENTFETETILDDVKISDSNQSSVKVIVDSPEEEFAFASPLNINLENDLCDTDAILNWSNQNSVGEKEKSICEMVNTTEKNASQVNEINDETPVFNCRQTNHNDSKIIETLSDELSEENINKSAQNKTIENVDLSNIIENNIAENDKWKDSSKLSSNNDTNKTNNDLQENYTESIDNLEKVQNDYNAMHSKTHVSDKECMSDMGSVTFDVPEDTNSNEECSALIEKSAVNNSVEKSSEEFDLSESNDVSKKTASELSSNNHVLSPVENLNEKLIDSIESQLNIIHNGIDTSNSDKENSVGNISKKITLSVNEQPTTSKASDHDNTQNASEVETLDFNNVDKSINDDDSKIYHTRNETSTVTTVESNVNHTENVQNISEQTSNICVKAAFSISVADTVGNVEPSINLGETMGNAEPNIKQTLQAQKSISENSPKHLEKGIEGCNLNESVELTKTLNVNDKELDEDNEHLNTTDKHFEQTLNTSIGKPQYESTPWNWFKNSKLPFNSTTGIEESKNTNQDDVTENNSKQKKKGVSTPLFDPDVWSQRMKDFNESVKKASVSETSNINAKPSSKVLFSESNQNISKELPEHESSAPKSAKERRQSKKNSLIQCPTITTCSPNSTTVPFDQVLIGNKRTTRSHNKSPEKTLTENKSMSKKNKSVKAKSPQVNTKSDDESEDNNISSLRSSRKSKSIVNETSSDTSINDEKLTVAKDATLLVERHRSIIDNDRSIMNKEQNLFKKISKSKPSSKVMNRPVKNKIIVVESTTDTDALTSTSDSEIDQESKIDSSSSQVSNRNKNNNSTCQTFSPVATKTRRNLRTRTNRNEARKSVHKQKVKKIDSEGTSCGTSADSDSDQNHSTNTRQISRQKLQEEKPESLISKRKMTVQNEIIVDLTNDDVGKEIPFNNDAHTSNKAIKNNSKANNDKESQKNVKTKATQKVKTSVVIQPRSRITRSNTTLTDSNLPIINKNKSPSPIKYKNMKGMIKIQTKKSSVAKANKKQQLAKRVQPPKKMNNNKLSETSEYETTSEEDEGILKPSPPPTVTRAQKKTTLIIAPAKNSKEKMTETSATMSQLDKGSRKRAADTSGISQPKAKGRKQDHTSKVASTTINRESMSSKEENSSPTTIKRTRNTSKTSVVLGSDTSLPITNEIKKDKTKYGVTRKSMSPKEQSSLTTTKRTRNTSKTKAPASNISLPITNEIKKTKPKAAATLESMSPKEKTSPTTNKRTRNTSKTKVLASDISLSTTNEIKKDKSKSVVTLESTSPKEKTSPANSKRTRNTSKTKVVLGSDTSLPLTNEVKKDKPKSTERARAKKRELNTHDSSADSAPARKLTRKALLDNKEPAIKKNNASVSLTKTTKAQSTDTDDTEPNISTRVRFNKNVDTKSISPRPKKTTAKSRNTKSNETDSETIPSRVLRVREKRK